MVNDAGYGESLINDDTTETPGPFCSLNNVHE